ncbi:hypothetical protein Hanom_Chr17g01571621 [Helianthus anomalus]
MVSVGDFDFSERRIERGWFSIGVVSGFVCCGFCFILLYLSFINGNREMHIVVD